MSAELRHRYVRIYQPTRNTMQSGGGKSERWRIDWDILEGGGRWENPLMGYASSYGLLTFSFLTSLIDRQGGLHARHSFILSK